MCWDCRGAGRFDREGGSGVWYGAEYMEHVTRNTEYVMKWCDTCRKITEHRCSDARIGPCIEDHHKKKEPEQKDMFPLPKTGDLF
jgi:hypothetical protein